MRRRAGGFKKPASETGSLPRLTSVLAYALYYWIFQFNTLNQLGSNPVNLPGRFIHMPNIGAGHLFVARMRRKAGVRTLLADNDVAGALSTAFDANGILRAVDSARPGSLYSGLYKIAR